MALAKWLALGLWLLPLVALAEAPDAGPTEAGPLAELIPPRPLKPTTVAYPENAPAHEAPIVVKVKILVNPEGAVAKVDPVTTENPFFVDAVVTAAKAFVFEPATYGGKPVPVEIAFTHTFQPPPPPPPPVASGPPLNSELRGRLVEMGTRLRVLGATVAARVDGRYYSVEVDTAGRFSLKLPAGDARITVHAPNYNAFLQQEKLSPGQALSVSYFLERDQYDPYEIVVVEGQRREEVSRITLRGPEIQQVPGTFGDPFRVIQTLPGTASMVSLLPFPVVRGASPSSTGFLLDGTRVPLLYHLLVGASVVHPEFIEEIQFYPGGAPVTYGGYTGGIIDGRTHRARRDEHLVDLDVNLTQAGAFVRQPIPGVPLTVTAAGRYGYPGLILSLATNQVSLSYWDYQFRLDGGTSRNGFTAMFFGAKDELDTPAPSNPPGAANPVLAPALILNFHRADLRGYHGGDKYDGTYRLVLGYDHTMSSGTNVATWVAEPSVRYQFRPLEKASISIGLEGKLHHFDQGQPSTVAPDAFTLTTITGNLRAMYVGSAYIEALIRPTDRWLIRPGLREDIYYDQNTTKTAFDPRLTLRFKLIDRAPADAKEKNDDDAVWLKAAVGIYHQPPRFILPLPGFDSMPLKSGLLESVQTSLGVEAPLPEHFSLGLEGYFAYMNPTIYDLSVNSASVNNTGSASLVPTTTTPQTTRVQDILDSLTTPRTGRAYGVEALIRRQVKSGVFGWLSYTLSRSERFRDGSWVPYDFDRTHLVNLVTGIRLPRNWDLGLRGQYQSGKPATTTAGYNAGRGTGYYRVDLRVDKRAVYKGWLLDFYVDLLNAALLPEEVTPGATMRYVLPTLGMRARF